MNLLNYWQLFLKTHAESGRYQSTGVGGKQLLYYFKDRKGGGERNYCVVNLTRGKKSAVFKTIHIHLQSNKEFRNKQK